jgi:hypothetical protein
MTMDELRSFVQESTWTFAKSMPQTPHQYTLGVTPRTKDFLSAWSFISDRRAISKKWGETTYTYLDTDGWQYWTMGSPLEQTALINRAAIRK